MNHRRPRLLTLTLAACLPAMGLLAAAIPAARAAGRHISSIPTVTSAPSSSDAGYADINTGGHTYSAVSGNWVEPTGTCPATGSTSTEFWVGIDGITSSSVEQDGTGIECFGGAPIYFTWWEMFPTNSVQVVSTALKPGDKIHASLTRNGTSYTLAVTDSTHSAASFTTIQTCATCANSSAEWDAQTSQSTKAFTPWNLTDASVTSGGVTGVITTFPNEPITTSNSSLVLGPLNASGNGFEVTSRST